jgi:hypothetical protein
MIRVAIVADLAMAGYLAWFAPSPPACGRDHSGLWGSSSPYGCPSAPATVPQLTDCRGIYQADDA